MSLRTALMFVPTIHWPIREAIKFVSEILTELSAQLQEIFWRINAMFQKPPAANLKLDARCLQGTQP